MADDINYQLILTKLEEKLKKYRNWNDTVKVRLLNADIQQLKAYLAGNRATPPNLSRWLRPEDFRRSALAQGQREIRSAGHPPVQPKESIQPLQESTAPAEPAERAADDEPEVAPATPPADLWAASRPDWPTASGDVAAEIVTAAQVEEPEEPPSGLLSDSANEFTGQAASIPAAEEKSDRVEIATEEAVEEKDSVAVAEEEPAEEQFAQAEVVEEAASIVEAVAEPETAADEAEPVDLDSTSFESQEPEATGEVEVTVAESQPEAETAYAAPAEQPMEEPASAMPSEAEIAAEAAFSGRSDERFQEEIRRIDVLKSGSDEGLSEALGICERLLSLEGLSEAARLQLAGQKREVEEERDRRYALWMEKGRAARKANDLEEARKAFSAAYFLTRSEEANNALAELNRHVERKGNEAAIRALEYELSIRTDIARLEKAVREAEASWVNGQLPDQLVEPMHKARQAFNDLRAQMGQITTSASLGDLSAAKDAVTKIENLMYGEVKHETFLDPLRGLISIQEALSDANHRWEDRSREFVSDTHAKVQKSLEDRPDQPEIAESILNLRLFVNGDPAKPQPIHPSVVADLEVDKKNVEEKLAQKRQAQQKVTAAGMAANPVEAYRLLLDARDDFPHLSGLGQRLERSRQQALDYLLARIKEKSSSVAWEKDHFNFSAARQNLDEAQALIASWPGKDQPEELKIQSQSGIALAAEITADEYKFKGFNVRYEKVKALEAAGRVNEALELLEGLLEDEEYSSDERYKQYTRQDLRTLNKKLNASKSAAEKLELARKAEVEQDWEEVCDLTEGLPGQEAIELHTRASDELTILDVARLLHEDQVAKAKKQLDALVNRRPALRERLQAELEKIRLAVEATPALQPFYDQAERDARKKGVTEQALALRKFRHLGGKPLDGERIPPAWPAYQLSLLTAPARERAATLADQMRAEFLKGLMEFSSHHQGKQVEPDPHALRIRADQARALREALLLQTEEERAAARWIELKHGMAEAAAIGSTGAWDKAVEMWEELDLIYPLTPSVQEGLKQAYIQQALLRMNGHLDQGEPAKALAVLQAAQQRPELIESVEIKFGLALVYERLKDFDKAQQVLKTIRSQDAGIRQQVEERVANLKREAIIHAALGQADELEAQAKAGGVKEITRRKLVRGALEALKKALDAGNGNRSRRLEERFNGLYRGEEARLLQTITDEIAKNTAEGNLDALLAMVDLEQLEDLKGIPAGQKNSRKKLAALKKGALENLVKYLVREARKLDPNPDNFDFVDEAAQPLYDKARDTYSKLQIVRGYSKDALLEERIARLSTIVGNLERLLKLDEDEQGKTDPWQDAVLEDGRNSTIWLKALAANDFTKLEQIQRNLEGMQLHQVNEVKAFILKLADVKRAAEHLNNGIADIRLGYREEKFSAVAEKIVELRDIRSMEDVSDLRMLNETLYRQLYEWVSQRLSVHTFDNATADGWENVRQDALKREENWSIWNRWVESLKPYLERASAAKNLADQFEVELPWLNAQGVVDTAAACGTLPPNARAWLPGLLALQGESKTLEVINPAGESYQAEFVLGDNLPLTYRMWAWVAALKHVGIVWLLLEGGPARFEELQGALERIDAAAKTAAEVCLPNRKNGKVQADLPEVLAVELLQELESYPVLSKKAAEIYNRVLALRGSAREMRAECLARLQDVYAQINVRDAYPLPGDFVKFQRAKDMGGFETRLQQARQIGPANPSEAQTYLINKRWWEKQTTQKSWIQKLLGGN